MRWGVYAGTNPQTNGGFGYTTQYGYDGENWQVGTKDTGTGQTISYLYDGLGQRVEKVISGGATTVFVHDAFGNLAAEYNSAGVTPVCAQCYLSYDQLGSTRMTDQGGNVVARHDFLPYGEELAANVAGRNDPKFGSGANVAQMFTGQCSVPEFPLSITNFNIGTRDSATHDNVASGWGWSFNGQASNLLGFTLGNSGSDFAGGLTVSSSSPGLSASYGHSSIVFWNC